MKANHSETDLSTCKCWLFGVLCFSTDKPPDRNQFEKYLVQNIGFVPVVADLRPLWIAIGVWVPPFVIICVVLGTVIAIQYMQRSVPAITDKC